MNSHDSAGVLIRNVATEVGSIPLNQLVVIIVVHIFTKQIQRSRKTPVLPTGYLLQRSATSRICSQAFKCRPKPTAE